MNEAVPLVTCTDVVRVHQNARAVTVAVRDVTCRVDPGDRIALVGPSGSGKSTLLHILAELDGPSSGHVEWPGLGDNPRRLLPGTVAVVFQAPSLIPTLDVTENVALPLVLAGASERQARLRAEEELERIGLVSLARRLPEEISGGQAQRAAMARTLVGRPPLVLADEPTGQLDRSTGQSLIDTLLGSLRADAGLVVATHDPTVAERLDVRWELTDGRLDAGVAVCSG